MSHFTVMVRIPDKKIAPLNGDLHEQLNAAVTEALAPFQENNMGDCPAQYMEFHDVEDEYIEEWENESTTQVKLADGSKLSPYDDRFRVKTSWEKEPGEEGMKKILAIVESTGQPPRYSKNGEYAYPHNSVEVETPHKETYATLEAFAKGWHGASERDEKKGRYGYWENPNKKWDWWVIGGRWRGQLPVKPGHPSICGEGGTYERLAKQRGEEWEEPAGFDGCRIESLDLEAIAREQRKSLDESWAKWRAFVDGNFVDKDPFGGARSLGLDYGFAECFDSSKPDEKEKIDQRVAEGWTPVPWTERPNWRNDPNRVDLYDGNLAREKFDRLCSERSSPTATYAFLDPEHGWCEPGEMGWWGMSSANPDSRVMYREKQRAWLKSGDQKDWIVVCDLHI